MRKLNIYSSSAMTCGFAIGLVICPSTASAQNVADAPPPSNSPAAASTGDASTPVAGAGGDIVVTALRRSSTLQNAPLSIAALTGDGLSKIGATGLQDYFRQIPNLNLTQAGGGTSRVAIRGINAAGEATVGLYFDETPITGPSGTSADAGNNTADLNLFDVERVEVLRGPQGTLYGSSSMAGTLRVIFKKPNSTRTEVAAETEVSSTDGGTAGYFFKGMINQPIVKDVLAVRIAGYYEKRPGYVDNIRYNTNNIDSSSSAGVRALIGLTPTDTLNITGTIIYQRTEQADTAGSYEVLGSHKTDSAVALPFNSTLNLYNLTSTWRLPRVTLTATGSYYKYKILRAGDFTPAINAVSQSPAVCRAYFAQAGACSTDQLAAFRAFGLSQLPSIGYQPAFLNSKTAELRAASNDKGPLQWTVGGFYEHRYDYIDSNIALANPSTGVIILPLELTSHRYVETLLTQKAAFSEASYTLFDKLTLTAGARYFDYTKVTGGATDKATPLTGTAITPYMSQTARATGWLEKVNISYRFTPHIMAYASASKGFRPGGANNIPSLPSALVVYQPDSLWNYELGLKSTLFDNAVTFNVALFQIDWSNIRTQAKSADGLYTFITNAGAARVRGGEVDLTVRPVAGLTLTALGGYTDARLRQDQANSQLLVTGSTGLKGDRLPGVPDFSGAASATYSWPVLSGYSGLVRADYTYTGSIDSTFRRDTDPNFEEYGKYSTIGARIGIERQDRGIYLYVQNLANADGITSAATSLGMKRLVYTIRPRTIGINARISF